MDISKLKYTKSDNGIREEKHISINNKEPIALQNIKIKNKRAPISPIISSPENSKPEPVLSPSLFFVISGGTDRERTYLNELEKKKTFSKLHVLFLSSEKGKGGLTPTMMNDKLVKIIKYNKVAIGKKVYRIKDIDKTFLFTDVDHYEEELRGLIPTHHKNAQWIISNPCFEIWLYYSFYNSPKSDLAEMIKILPSKRSLWLKTRNGKMNNGGGIDTRKAFENIDKAITNAKQHYCEDEAHFPSLYSTQMYHLEKHLP